MKKVLFFGAVFLALGLALVVRAATETKAPAPEWSMNATAIEACSCPMFCQCYFATSPAGHHHEGGEEHFCKFNNAYKINKGHVGKVNLDGTKFWVSGDLGGDFSKGQMDWAVVTFDKTESKEQRDAIVALFGHLFPVKWNSFTTAEGTIDKWEITKDGAQALLDGGKTAEVQLKRFQGMNKEPVIMKNLQYWGATRNDGFIMAPNVVEAYHVGPKAYEFKGTNGFLITIDMNSNDGKTM